METLNVGFEYKVALNHLSAFAVACYIIFNGTVK